VTAPAGPARPACPTPLAADIPTSGDALPSKPRRAEPRPIQKPPGQLLDGSTTSPLRTTDLSRPTCTPRRARGPGNTETALPGDGVGRTSLARASLPSGATPFGVFPSPAASTRHRASFPHAVQVLPWPANTFARTWTHSRPRGLAPPSSPLLAPALPLDRARYSLGLLRSTGPVVGSPSAHLVRRGHCWSVADTPTDAIGEPVVLIHVECDVAPTRCWLEINDLECVWARGPTFATGRSGP